MNNQYYIPKDTEQMTKEYEIDKGGICGQSCLAVIERLPIKKVLKNWKELGLEFKGWSGWKQLKEYLEERGYEVKFVRRKNINFFNLNKNDFCILRVQWIGEKAEKEKPFYGWGHWAEASAHTHFVVIVNKKVFCNEDGWFDVYDLNKYLNGEAVITSAMEVTSK